MISDKRLSKAEGLAMADKDAAGIEIIAATECYATPTLEENGEDLDHRRLDSAWATGTGR